MKQRRIVFVVMIVLAILAAASAPALAGKAHKHTVSGHDLEGVAFYYPAVDESDAAAACVLDGYRPEVQAVSHASGKVNAQLGTATLDMMHCYYGVDDEGNEADLLALGEFTLTAENGDTLTGTYTGAPGTMWVDAIVTGGTGRFAAATGTFKIDYSIGEIMPDPHFPQVLQLYSLIEFDLKGKVTY